MTSSNIVFSQFFIQNKNGNSNERKEFNPNDNFELDPLPYLEANSLIMFICCLTINLFCLMHILLEDPDLAEILIIPTITLVYL